MKNVNKEIAELKTNMAELSKNYETLLALIGKGSPNSKKLLVVAMDEYMAYLRNEGVQPHLVKERTPKYIWGMLQALDMLKTVIKTKYRNLMNFKTYDLDDELVGWYYLELKKRNYSDRTFNIFRTNINSFELWMVDKGYITKRNFVKIQRKQIIFNPRSITKIEFENLLKITKPETGRWINNLSKRYHYRASYRPWFTTGFRLTLELGVRRNELITFKFSDVIEENGKPVYIRIEDTKVNNIRKVTDDRYKKYKALPISKELLKTLMECGYKKNRGKDIFVLAPEITDMVARKHHVAMALSAAFKYYYRKLNTGRTLSMNSLRIADGTGKYRATRGRPELLTGHSSPYVAVTHYVDKIEIAKAATKEGYSVFS